MKVVAAEWPTFEFSEWEPAAVLPGEHKHEFLACLAAPHGISQFTLAHSDSLQQPNGGQIAGVGDRENPARRGQLQRQRDRPVDRARCDASPLTRPAQRKSYLCVLTIVGKQYADVADKVSVLCARDTDLSPFAGLKQGCVPHRRKEGGRLLVRHRRPSLVAGNFGIVAIRLKSVEIIRSKTTENGSIENARKWIDPGHGQCVQRRIMSRAAPSPP